VPSCLGVDTFEGKGFEAGFLGLIGLDQGLDVVLGGGVMTSGDLGFKITGEVFGEDGGDRAKGGGGWAAKESG